MTIIDRIFPGLALRRERIKTGIAAEQAKRRAYDAAGVARRVDSWRTTGADANTENSSAISKLRDRAREMRRNNPWAKRGVNLIANNVVGAGIIPKWQSDKMQAVWKLWAESKQCDSRGRNTIYSIMHQAMISVIESGECIIRRRRRFVEDGLALPFQLQIIEGDHIDSMRNEALQNGGQIVNGIQFSVLGKIEGYWLFDNHPGSGFFAMNSASKFVGADDVIHVYREDRPGQVRGVTWLHSVMIRMRDHDEMDDALINQAKIAACFSAFITKDPNDSLIETVDDEITERLGPGMIEHLRFGESVSFASPPTFNGYKDYTWNTLHAVAAGLDVPYEALSGDLSGVNFSSGRMGWLEFGRNIDVWQWQMFIPLFCEKLADWVIEGAQLMGINPGGRPEWTPPRRDMIDPQKETDTTKDRIRSGLQSLSGAIREQGYSDPKALLQEVADDYKLLDDLGLSLDIDPRKFSPPGGAQINSDTGSNGQ